MVAGNSYDIQVIMQVAQRLILEKFMFRVSHGNSQYHSLNPCQVGRQTRNPAVTLDMSATVILLIVSQCRLNVKYILGVWSFPRGRCLHPKAKALGFDTEI